MKGTRIIENADVHADNISSDLNTLKKDIAAVGKDIGHKATEKFQDLKEKGQAASGVIEDQAYKLGAKAKETLDEASEVVKAGVSYLETQSKNHPYMVAGISFVLGMLLAKISFTNKKD